MEETTKAAEGGADNAILEGIAAIGTDMERGNKALDGRIAALEKKQATDKKDTDDTVNRSFEAVIDRMDSRDKRDTVLGRLSVSEDPSNALLNVIPDSERGLVRRMAANMDWAGVRTREVSPLEKGATALWFKHALRAQRMSDFPQQWQASQELAGNLCESMNSISGITKADLLEGADSTGGFGVPDVIMSDLLRIVLDNAVVFSRARKVPMTSNRLEIPNEATGVTVRWVAEAGTLTSGEPTQGVNILDAKKIIGRALVSRELDEDSIVAIFPYLQTVFAEAISRELDQEALEGSGTNLTGVEAESSRNTIGNVTGATVTYGNLVSIMFAAGEDSTRKGAAWFMNPALFGSIYNLTDSNGRPLVLDGNIQNAPFPTLLGRPVYLTNVLDVTKTVGGVSNNGSIYFGDPNTLIFGMKRDMRFEVSEHAQWATDKLDLKVTMRVGYTVANPAAWTEGLGFVKLGG